MTEPDFARVLSPDRLDEMEPWERILYYEHVEIATMRRQKDRRAEAGSCLSAGMAHAAESRFEEARYYFEYGRQLFGELGEELGCAQAENNLGLAEVNLGRFAEAGRHFARAFEEAARLGESALLKMAADNLLKFLAREGGAVDPAARGQYAEIEAQARRFGLSEVAVQAARTLADALLTVEDHSAESAAGAALDRALDTALAAGDESAFEIAAQLEELGTGYGDGYLAYLSWWAAQAHELLKAGPAEAEQAADVLRQLLGRVDRMGDRAQALVDRNEVLFALAECEAAVGDYQEAIACLDEALHGFRAKSAHLREGATANILATLYLELGEFETAASYAKLDIRICAELQDMLGEAKTRFVLARIRQAAGRPRAARAEYRRCVTLLRGVGSDEAEFMIRAIEQMLKQAPEEET